MDRKVDLSDVKRMLEILERHQLEALEVTEGELTVSLTAAPVADLGDARQRSTAGSVPVVRSVDGDLLQLRAPITGVFYRSANPGDPSFVQEGETVDAETTVCLIEAMKIFNEINAGLEGRLARVVAQNEQLVVAGEVLMEFEPLGSEAA